MTQEFPSRKEGTIGRVTPEQDRSVERRLRCEHLCQSGDYGTILSDFSKPENVNLLQEQIQRMQEKEGTHRLREAAPFLREHDWEMLTILELFDQATFEHCLRTYAIAREKIESPGPVGVYLRQHIETEGLDPWDIELACLLHDMGKISLIPKDTLLNNTLSDSGWHELFERFCHDSFSPEEASENIRTYEQKLQDNPLLREKDITPLSLGLTPEEKIALDAKGFDSRLPLGTIMAQHQDVSVMIAGRYYPVNSPILNLIGNHHERPIGKAETAPISQSVVRFSSLTATLRLADAYDAYRSARPYKHAGSHLSALAFLVTQAEFGTVDRTLTKLWIENDLAKKDFGFSSQENEKDTTAYEKIKAFLAE